jgi:hypothetical protein
MCGFFTRKTKKWLVFEKEFHHAFSYKNCAGCAIRKSHLVVLVVLESISPTNLINTQRRQHKVNGTKDAVQFHQHLR